MGQSDLILQAASLHLCRVSAKATHEGLCSGNSCHTNLEVKEALTIEMKLFPAAIYKYSAGIRVQSSSHVTHFSRAFRII